MGLENTHCAPLNRSCMVKRSAPMFPLDDNVDFDLISEISAEDDRQDGVEGVHDNLLPESGIGTVNKKATKRQKIQLTNTLPKVMKHDIRRYFARMFMNTVNSADFVRTQNFFSTFMTGPCRFVSEHEVRPEFAIPSLMVAIGPRIMSHYLLGCFVMYPDMVMSMIDSRIVTSSSWSGTKIVMHMKVQATKMYDIELADWIPQLATLDEHYAAAARANLVAHCVVDEPTQAGATFTPTSTTAAGTTTEVVTDANNAGATGSSGGAGVSSNSANDYRQSYIPDAYVYALFSRAKLLPNPHPLVLQGEITMFLDENNHIQHMNLSMVQQSTTG